MDVQKSNIGHLKKVFGYKMLRLLRSYLAAEGGQERINKDAGGDDIEQYNLMKRSFKKSIFERC
jgi:hypothetical protein